MISIPLRCNETVFKSLMLVTVTVIVSQRSTLDVQKESSGRLGRFRLAVNELADEIWRHFCLLISAPGIEPGAPDDWYLHN